MLKYLLGFSMVMEIGPRKFERLEKYFSTLEAAWNAGETELEKAGLTGKDIASIAKVKNSSFLDRTLDQLKKENIVPISRKLDFEDCRGVNEEFFPENLNRIPDRPFLIFCKGEVGLLKKHQLAVVGSRKPTSYGKMIMDKIVSRISSGGIIITSGMALGTDALAHRAALDNNRPTIAALGNGLAGKTLAQSVNFKLAEEIVNKNGLLVSEYPPFMPANKFTFPARNRLISGLSMGVLVAEAGFGSGTLITAGHALEQNREIFAVPGNVFSPQSAGTNQLIQQGAFAATSAEDILRQLDWNQQPEEEKQVEFEDETEARIYQNLFHEPQPIDKLALQCKLDISTISVKLSMMELKGTAKGVEGGYVKN